MQQNKNREFRRRTKKIALKMMAVSKAWIVILWDGKDSSPTAIFDISALTGQENIIAVTMRNITGFIGRALAWCASRAAMTVAQAKQADAADMVKEQRSRELEKFNANET